MVCALCFNYAKKYTTRTVTVQIIILALGTENFNLIKDSIRNHQFSQLITIINATAINAKMCLLHYDYTLMCWESIYDFF